MAKTDIEEAAEAAERYCAVTAEDRSFRGLTRAAIIAQLAEAESHVLTLAGAFDAEREAHARTRAEAENRLVGPVATLE